jgi:glutamate-1-semialdehyde 2,1-aminomutase
MLTAFFLRQDGQRVDNYAQAVSCDTAAYALFFNAMLDEGVFLAPSQYEAMFVGLAHGPEVIEQTVQAARKAMQEVGKKS